MKKYHGSRNQFSYVENEDFISPLEVVDKEEDEDEIYLTSIDRISSLVTLWYMSGVDTSAQLDELLDEISRQDLAETETETEAEAVS